MAKPQQTHHNQMRIYGERGERLYLDEAERQRFLKAVAQQEPQIQTLCLVLFYTGCRISEALALTPDSLRVAEGVICFRTLKRRGLFVREVPVPRDLLELLQNSEVGPADATLWPLHRGTAWRQVKRVMQLAQIVGPQATPKGLRHAFGISAVRAHVPLTLLAKWLGHAHLSTTGIYSTVSGADERRFAEKTWQFS